MTTEQRPKEPTSAYIHEVVIPLAANFEASAHQVVSIVETLGPQAPAAKEAFVTFSDKFAEMLLTIEVLTANNKELRELFETSLVTKAKNTQIIAENVRQLRRVDPFLIGVIIEEVSTQEIMRDAIAGIKRRGPVQRMRLDWIREALKDVE